MRKRFRKVERACARLEGWGRPRGGALMLRDAALRAAPQHEGATGTRQSQPAAVGNDRGLRSVVSGLLFTMTSATPTCRAVSARSGRPARARRDGRAHSAPRSRSTSSATRWPSIAAGIPQ